MGYNPGVFRRLLAGLSIASLLVGVVVLVIWWRSYRHVDRYWHGSLESTRTAYTSRDGRVMVTTSQNVGGVVATRSEFYEHWRLAAGCLCVPGFWVAVMLRRRLPRPGRLTPADLQRLASGKTNGQVTAPRRT